MGHDECLGPDVAKTQLEKISPSSRMESLQGVDDRTQQWL